MKMKLVIFISCLFSKYSYLGWGGGWGRCQHCTNAVPVLPTFKLSKPEGLERSKEGLREGGCSKKLSLAIFWYYV